MNGDRDWDGESVALVNNHCIKIHLKSLKDFIYLFLERGKGRERERERETSMCSCLLRTPTGDLAHNPGMCPVWELNLRPFVPQFRAQSTEPCQPRLHLIF